MSKIATAPIDHWSHSSLGLLLRNPLAFKKKYILKIYTSTMSPSGVVGQAAHKAVEHYLKGMAINDAIAEGLKHLNSVSDTAIDFGKTGSREQMLKDYTQGVNFYFAELPPWAEREVLFVEEGMTEVVTDDEGNELPLPAKCYFDVVWRAKKKVTIEGRTYPKGSLFIEDNKFVKSFSDPEEQDPARFRQAFFNKLVLRARMKEEPVAFLARETKLSKNKDGSDQCQYAVFDFAEIAREFPVFVQLYNDCTRFISNPDVIYLPNTSDLFDGKDAWLAYSQNLISADAPVIAHKTGEVKFTEKQYQPSAIAKTENKHYTPEEKIRLKLQEFGIPVEMQETHQNGSVVMYTLKPSRGVKMKTIEGHAQDLAIALSARSIRVQAPIMGTEVVGVEVPNENRSTVPFTLPDGETNPILGLEAGSLNVPIGVDVYGKVITKDLRKMPHLLIAGTTGSGKSVMEHTAILALTQQNTPEQLNLVLIDPKRVELEEFADLPHTMSKVIHEHREAIKALRWLVGEMEERYKTLHSMKYRSIEKHNDDQTEKMPYIVVVIDEFADLMLTKERGEPSEAEVMVVRLAQKGRAAGIHLIMATQRPSVDVVTGLIKANFPTRICMTVPSATDSRVVIDEAGGEELVGNGDMLFKDPAKRGLQRLQGFYA